MRFSGLIILWCFSVSVGQIVLFESEIELLQPLGTDGFLMIQENSSDSTSVSRLDQNANVLWSTVMELKSINGLHEQDSTILAMGNVFTAQGYRACINKLDRSTGELISENTYSDSLIGYISDCIELPDGQILLFGGNGVFSLNPDMSIERITTLPEITVTVGASLMADGNLEVVGTVIGENLWLLWITPEGELIYSEDRDLITDVSYGMQPSNTASIVIYPWTSSGSSDFRYFTLRSVMSPPGENLFTEKVYDYSASCVTEDRYSIIVREVSSCTFSIEKFQETGNSVWTSEIDIQTGDYSNAYLKTIVKSDSGFALAGWLHDYSIGRQDFILFLDDQGRLNQDPEPSDCLNLSFSPNPFRGSGILNAALTILGTISIDVIDLSGRLVGSFGPVTGAGDIIFTIENLPPGMYLINALYDSFDGTSLSETLKIICINP